MELAGVQAICDFYGFELYDFLVAGDVLIEGNYETDGLSAANHDHAARPRQRGIAGKIAGQFLATGQE